MHCRLRMLSLCVAVIIGTARCNFNPEDISLSDRGTPFVVKGTAAVIDNEGPCLIWRGDNGETYHLFQDPTLENEAFDQIIDPGVTSHLVLVTRSDLTLDCQIGLIVEVRDVLEVVE